MKPPRVTCLLAHFVTLDNVHIFADWIFRWVVIVLWWPNWTIWSGLPTFLLEIAFFVKMEVRILSPADRLWLYCAQMKSFYQRIPSQKSDPYCPTISIPLFSLCLYCWFYLCFCKMHGSEDTFPKWSTMIIMCAHEILIRGFQARHPFFLCKNLYVLLFLLCYLNHVCHTVLCL